MTSEIHPTPPLILPLVFLGMWLFITTILGLMSGWFALQRRYPRGDEQPLLTLRRRSGMMGLGVRLSGILTLSTCASGLRIGIWRLFGPFQRPFLVPWSDIEMKSGRTLFVPAVKLVFGAPETGSLKIDAWTWQRLVAACPNAPRDVVSPVTRSRMALGIGVEWAVLSLAAGAFFHLVTAREAHGNMVPMLLSFALPAAVFGIGEASRFVRLFF